MHERTKRSLHLGSDRRRGRVRVRVALARLVSGAGTSPAWRFRAALARLVSGAGTSPAWRFRAALAAVAVAALALGTTAAVTGDGDEIDVRALADDLAEPSTTMTLPPTTGTTEPQPTEPPPPGRRRLAADRNAGWELLLVDDGSRCLELVVGPWRQGSLLCGVPPATDLIGDVEAVDTPSGRMAVAVMEPYVTNVAPIAGSGAAVAADPTDERFVYAVVPGGGHGVLGDFLVAAGADTVARVILPATSGRLARSQLTVVADRPYGRWPGYRQAGMTGLFFGGLQLVGFYDGPDGEPCVLYRRLGGVHEEVLADACPDHDPSRPLAFSRLTPIPMDTPEPGYLFVAVSDQPVTAWRCERATGESCGDGPEVFADPRGTGRVVLAQWIAWVTPGPHDHVVLVLTVGQEERRVAVPVRG